MTTFVAPAGSSKGYVAHHLLDWGDIFGTKWDSDQMSRRFGHSYYLDFEDVGVDLATLGIIERPWDRAVHNEGPAQIFGYFGVADFEPTQWKDGYPNPAFSRMDDGDAFWAARIISRFSDAHVERLVAEAKLASPEANAFLERTLKGRRDRIVKYYLNRLAALDRPRLRDHVVCFADLLVVGGFADLEDTDYTFRLGNEPWGPAASVDRDGVCYELPHGAGAADYQILEGRIQRAGQLLPAKPARFHFSKRDGETIQLVGIER